MRTPSADFDLTPDEINSVDVSLFDPAGVAVPSQLASAEVGFDHLVRKVGPGQQLGLFVPSGQPPTAETSLETLWDVAVRAYIDSREERSIDFVIADPSSNARFIRRCWELGAAATPAKMNWLLLNARKSGRLTDQWLEPATPVGMTRDRMDQISFAADIGMRYVQDRLYCEQQRDVSVDGILCDPHLAREFDSIASRIAPPGFASFDFRWTAISLRKARRKKANPRFDHNMVDCGRVHDIRSSSLPTASGVYSIRAGDTSLFVGVAGNLRNQIDCLIERMGSGVIPDLGARIPERAMPSILLSTMKLGSAESVQSSMLAQMPSMLNHRHFNSLCSAA